MDSPNTMGYDTFADRQACGATNPSTPKASISEDEIDNLAISTTVHVSATVQIKAPHGGHGIDHPITFDL